MWVGLEAKRPRGYGRIAAGLSGYGPDQEPGPGSDGPGPGKVVFRAVNCAFSGRSGPPE